MMNESRSNILTRSMGAILFLVWSLLLLINLDSDASSPPDQDQQVNQSLEQSHNAGPGISCVLPSLSGLSIANLLDLYFPPADCSVDYLCTLNIHNHTVQVHLKIFDRHLLTPPCLHTHGYTIRSHPTDDAGPLFS